MNHCAGLIKWFHPVLLKFLYSRVYTKLTQFEIKLNHWVNPVQLPDMPNWYCSRRDGQMLHGVTCNYLCPDSIWKNRCVCKKKKGCNWKNMQVPTCMELKQEPRMLNDATNAEYEYDEVRN